MGDNAMMVSRPGGKSTIERQWNGARWWRFDFHAHTPASTDYGKGPDSAALSQRSSREWLLDFMRAEIDCVAVTDHNSGARIDELKQTLEQLRREEPDGFRNLALYPGVEVTAHGNVHILGIFAPNTTSSDIDSFLGAVGFSGTKGTSDGCTTQPLTEVVSEIVKAGGIAIPAHVDDARGLFKEIKGNTLRQALNHPEIFSMEILDAEYSLPQLYTDEKLNWTRVLGSDAHHPTGDSRDDRYPGSHFTWVKMGEPSFEGLRLALLDGPMSVRCSDDLSRNPNIPPSSEIVSIKVRNARFMGRANPFQLELNPWLNAIIGGRGTGKSTTIEFLRLALRRQGELPEALRGEFEKYGETDTNGNAQGLLKENALIEIVYRKDNDRYHIQWSVNGESEPIQVETGTGWIREEGDIVQRFPVRIYSQKQIFELTKTPLALLRIIDAAAEVNRAGHDEAWRDEETRFLSLRAKGREIATGLADAPRLRGELEDVKRKLAVFEASGHADVLKTFQKRRRQQRALENWEQEWQSAGERIKQLASEIAPGPLERDRFNDTDADESALLEKSEVARTALTEIAENMVTLATRVEDVWQQWQIDRNSSAWRIALDVATRAYEALQERLESQGVGDPAEYGEYVQRRQSIEDRLRALEEKRVHLDQVKQDAEQSLERLRDLRRALTKRRSQFLNNILAENQFIKIEVTPYGSVENVESEFRHIIQRPNRFDRAIEGLLSRFNSHDTDGDSVEQKLQELKADVRNLVCENPNAPSLPYQAGFVDHLKGLRPEVFDHLDLWFLEDSLDVRYCAEGDGWSFKPLGEGSPGQRTAALLAFLLSYGDEPIVLDQPEDDLDNHLIYDLIVRQLRENKQRRQVILVTHNANIVVNGDAELVVALAARGGETKTVCAGAIQERNVQQEICDIMEGGREAFEQRYRKIFKEGHRV